MDKRLQTETGAIQRDIVSNTESHPEPSFSVDMRVNKGNGLYDQFDSLTPEQENAHRNAIAKATGNRQLDTEDKITGDMENTVD